MSVTLKRLLGEAGAGLDEAHGFDTLYDVLVAMVGQQEDLAAQFNQLLTDYNAQTNADHTANPSTATPVSTGVVVIEA